MKGYHAQAAFILSPRPKAERGPGAAAVLWPGWTVVAAAPPYTENDVPQPHAFLAFGLLKTKPLPFSPPE